MGFDDSLAEKNAMKLQVSPNNGVIDLNISRCITKTSLQRFWICIVVARKWSLSRGNQIFQRENEAKRHH